MKTGLVVMTTVLLLASAGVLAKGGREDSSCKFNCSPMGMDAERTLQSNPSAAGPNSATTVEKPVRMEWYRRDNKY